MSAARRDDLAYLIGLLLAFAVAVGFGFLPLWFERYSFNDFSYVWSGPRTLVEGGDPYVAADWLSTVTRLRTQGPYEPTYLYPPWVLLALVPLGLLPLPIASALWTFGSLALAILALRALLREVVPGLPLAHGLVGFALLASQPGTGSLWSGQWSFLLVAALAATLVGLRRARTASAAFALALLGKPQLFVFTLWAIVRAALARGAVRFAVALCASFAAVIAAGWLALPQWWRPWTTFVLPAKIASVPPATTLASALIDLIGPWGALAAAILALGMVGVGLAFDPRSDAHLAVWTAISAAASVYTWSYDQLLLVVPLAIATGSAARRSRRLAVYLVSAGAALFLLGPMLLYAVATARGRETLNAFIPVSMLVLIVVALWRERRAP